VIKIAFNTFFFKRGTCSRCAKEGDIVERNYAGDTLCPQCFEEFIERKISKTISKYSMLSSKDRVVIALSGGKDSVSLLYNLVKYQEKMYHPEPMIALTINEGIANYRDPGMIIAENLCKKLGIELKSMSFSQKVGKTLDEIVQIKQQSGQYRYACNYCALIKRRLLNEEAKQLNADILAMGHNLTDIAETFLMNIMYKRIPLIGSQYPLKSTKARVEKYYVKKILPLMEIPEEEIHYYVNIKGFPHMNSLCPNRMNEPIARKRIFEFLQQFKELSPEIEFNLFHGFIELSKILHDANSEGPPNNCEKCGYPCGGNKLKCSYCEFMEDLEKEN